MIFSSQKELGDRDRVPEDIKQPKLNKRQKLKVIVCAGGSNNGLYTARCQAVWHGVHPQEFQSLFSTSDMQRKAVHFLRQMLREKEWMNCTWAIIFKMLGTSGQTLFSRLTWQGRREQRLLMTRNYASPPHGTCATRV